MPRLIPHPWAHAARFYHIYPLGCCGAPAQSWGQGPVPRLDQLHGWIEHLLSLGVNAVYLGPLFFSGSHGYDTIDYYRVDPRLGETETLSYLVRLLHSHGIRVVLDGVLNHVGRGFWAFEDLRRHLRHSAYTGWFQRLNFHKRGRAGDPFSYQGWKGHHDLVKLNLGHAEVKAHLLGAVTHWIRTYDIDGLRLDAADCMNLAFLSRLANHTRRLKKDFWLMGEVVHGDYGRWIHKGKLDSVTNYELFDALYKAHNASDYHKLAHSLQRQFGPHGVYRGLQLYHFVDNHDVDRIASRLRNPAHLYPLHLLLYTLPGIPSLYYGSEWGISGKKAQWNDGPLRPAIEHPYHYQPKPHADLMGVIARLAGIHAHSEALQYGDWQLLHESRQTLAYARRSAHEALVIVVNASNHPSEIALNLPWHHGELIDLLNPGERFAIRSSQVRIGPLYANWGRILRWHSS